MNIVHTKVSSDLRGKNKKSLAFGGLVWVHWLHLFSYRYSSCWAQNVALSYNEQPHFRFQLISRTASGWRIQLVNPSNNKTSSLQKRLQGRAAQVFGLGFQSVSLLLGLRRAKVRARRLGVRSKLAINKRYTWNELRPGLKGPISDLGSFSRIQMSFLPGSTSSVDYQVDF